ETDDRHMIAEEILRPGDVARRRCDVERDVEHLLVVVVARPQHHAMLAEGHRPPVMIGRDVPDGENRHDGPALLRPVICTFRAKNMSKYARCAFIRWPERGAGSVASRAEPDRDRAG